MQYRFFRSTTRPRGRTTPAPVSRAQAVGISIEAGSLAAVCVVLGLFAGGWLDERFGTTWVFTFLAIGLGLASAVLGTMRQYRTAARRRAAELAAAPGATAEAAVMPTAAGGPPPAGG